MRQPDSLLPADQDLPLMTDLYELTMAAGYFLAGKHETVAFEAFVRTLPPNRGFLLAAGLEQALHYVLALRFDGSAIDYLRSLPQFAPLPTAFFDYLRDFRFAGDLWAVPEGTPVLAGEPLIRVEGDLIQAQILETCLLTCLNIQTLVATKAARVNIAARGRPVVDFGARRAHGPQAGLLAARGAIIGGCTGTSNVHAARRLSVPPVGTMAHSWIMAFATEREAFARFDEAFPGHTVCLIDTYDTVGGAAIAAATLGARLRGVRLDSGNLLTLSKQVRRVLDENGCPHATIVASSDLNEWAIRDLLAAGAPIDSFGVGTDMVTSKDAPALSLVYKLVATQDPQGPWRAVVKRSEDKATLGERKQVWRQYDAAGRATGDRIGLIDETQPGEPLLRQYVAAGRLVRDLPAVAEIAAAARAGIESLPPGARELRGSYAYPVQTTPALRAAQPDTEGG